MAGQKPSAILIIGLPGSGKTTYAQQFVKQGYELIDDPMNPDDIKTWCDVVITDVSACHNAVLEKYTMPFLKDNFDDIRVISFENNPEQCLKNCAERADEKKYGVQATIDRLSKVYNPTGEIVKVYGS